MHGHLDYGLPNVLPVGVIDWQHHGLVPLGYDVALALEVIPFKGGTKGYRALLSSGAGTWRRWAGWPAPPPDKTSTSLWAPICWSRLCSSSR